MNNQQQKPQTITLEYIARLIAFFCSRISSSFSALSRTTRRIFAPLAPAASKGDALMRSFNTGMAVFDGVMLGWKILKQVRRFFRRN